MFTCQLNKNAHPDSIQRGTRDGERSLECKKCIREGGGKAKSGNAPAALPLSKNPDGEKR